MRKLSSIRASASDGAVELWIVSEINSWTSADMFAAFSAFGTSSDYIVNINSAGGEPFAAFAIRDYIKAKGVKCTARIWGHAASAAAIIASACDRVEMGDMSHMMIHNAYGGSDQGLLDSLNAKQVQVFREKTGMSASAISKMMDAETWMDAKEAKALGFADAIIKELAIAAMFKAQHMELNNETPAPEVTPEVVETPAVVTPEAEAPAADPGDEQPEPTEDVEQEVTITVADAVSALTHGGKLKVKVPVAAALNSELKARTEELKAKATELDEVKAEVDGIKAKIKVAEDRAAEAEAKASKIEASFTEALSKIKAMEDTPVAPATVPAGEPAVVIPAAAPNGNARKVSASEETQKQAADAMKRTLENKNK